MKIYHWADSVGMHWEFEWPLAVVGNVAAWVYDNWPRTVMAVA